MYGAILLLVSVITTGTTVYLTYLNLDSVVNLIISAFFVLIMMLLIGIQAITKPGGLSTRLERYTFWLGLFSFLSLSLLWLLWDGATRISLVTSAISLIVLGIPALKDEAAVAIARFIAPTTTAIIVAGGLALAHAGNNPTIWTTLACVAYALIVLQRREEAGSRDWRYSENLALVTLIGSVALMAGQIFLHWDPALRLALFLGTISVISASYPTERQLSLMMESL